MVTDSLDSVMLLPSIERFRKLYAAHISAGHTAETFAGERLRPERGLDFAFIGRTPKAKSTSTYYRCSFCQTDRKFAAGIVVLSSDGRLRLIGPDCWKEHIDTEQYRAQEADLRDYELRQRFALHRDRIHASVRDAVPRVRTLAHARNSLLDLAEGFPRVIEQDASGLSALLRRLRPDGGRLTVETYVPDERAGKNEQGRYLKYRPEQTVVHRVAGLDAAFSSHTGLTAMAQEAYQSLRKAEEAIPLVPDTGDNAVAAKEIRVIQRRIGHAAGHLATLRNAWAPFKAFLAPANLHGIALWSQHDDCADERLSGAITFERDELVVGAGATSLRLVVPPGLAGFEVPELDEVARLLSLT